MRDVSDWVLVTSLVSTMKQIHILSGDSACRVLMLQVHEP